MELVAFIIIVVQVMLFFWFIETLGKIKLYLRDIRDIAQRLDRDL
jgi:hypothetical protein